MILIAHRGIFDEKNCEYQNTTKAIEESLNMGYNVEIDIQFYNGCFWYGHDFPIERIKYSNFNDGRILWHAKDYETLIKLRQLGVHHFCHENDKYSYTSNGILINYPGEKFVFGSIINQPELDCLDEFISDVLCGKIHKDDIYGVLSKHCNYILKNLILEMDGK